MPQKDIVHTQIHNFLLEMTLGDADHTLKGIGWEGLAFREQPRGFKTGSPSWKHFGGKPQK